jgi:hypothetical protein
MVITRPWVGYTQITTIYIVTMTQSISTSFYLQAPNLQLPSSHHSYQKTMSPSAKLGSAQFDSYEESTEMSDNDHDDQERLLGQNEPTKNPSSRQNFLYHHRHLLSTTTFALAAVALLMVLTFNSTQLHWIDANMARGVNLRHCGKSNTVEEARSLGCIFDPMSWVWVRPECYDAELVEDFMNRTDWSWHTDPKLTPVSAVPMEEIYRGYHPKLFISKMYHTVHCSVSDQCVESVGMFRTYAMSST